MLEDVPKEGSPLKITGSVMMAVASTKEEVLEKIKKDIYHDEGVWDMDKVSDPCHVERFTFANGSGPNIPLQVSHQICFVESLLLKVINSAKLNARLQPRAL